MKRVGVFSSLVFALLFMQFKLYGQSEIEWTFSYNQEEKELTYTASLAEGWHVYSQFLDENAGPVATTFSIEDNDSLVISKKIKEPKGKTVFDKNFNSEITYFSDKVVFRQKVSKIKSDTFVKGSVLFMVCDDNGCLPPDVVEFKIEIKK